MGKEESKISPQEIAKYLLIKAERDGELISPLKMQKLIYFAYVVYLLEKKGKDKLFVEGIEAWPAGPVVPSLYRDLKKYGSMPINIDEYVDVSEEDLTKKYPEETGLLDKFYNEFGRYTAFELVMQTHQEKAWLEARKGLSPNESSNNTILDKHILEQHLFGQDE